MNHKYDYDVIIAGGGMSGLITASSIAYYSKQNARILVIDRNQPDEAGKKTINGWTCGDATSKNSLEFLRNNIGISYSYPELEHKVKGVLLFSPDHGTEVLFEGEGFMLNRKLLPQKQVLDAKRLGVDFIFGVSVESLIAEDGWVRGIVGRNVKDGSVFKKTASIVIDSAGSATKLRQHLPINSKIEKEIDKDDLESTGRYIYEFDEGEDDKTWFDPDYAIIHLDQYLAPGGYCLAPGSLVMCKDGLKPIEKLKIGDEVLTSIGWMPISDTAVRQYSGDLIVVTPWMLNFQVRLTPEHLVKVWSRNEGEVWRRAEELIDGKDKEYYLIIPLPNEDDNSLIESAANYVKGSFYSVGETVLLQEQDAILKNGFVSQELTEDLLELLGWYISAGCMINECIIISNLDAKKSNHVMDLVSKLNLEISCKIQSIDARYYNVLLNSRSFVSFVCGLFGQEIIDKKLPYWIHRLSRKAKLALLNGVFQSDLTNLRKECKGLEGLIYSATSNKTAMDLWLLLAETGIVASLNYQEESKEFVISITLPPDTMNSGKIYDVPFTVSNGKVYLKIKEVKKELYSGPVYDISSAGDFTAIFNVHNCWTFPKGKSKVNIGLGVQKSALDKRNKTYGKNDNLQSLIDQYVAANKAIKNPRQSSSDMDSGNTKGSWQVPVRRHNDCLVANGYAIVGDAAWMPRPIDAGGIGPCIYSSVILGKIVAQALEANDTSENGLWNYNIEYMKTYGYQMASFQVLRAYLQTLTNQQIDYGMKYFLSEDDVAHITHRQHPEFDRIRLLNPVMWARILKEPKLARNLRYTAKKSQELIKHNLDFPEKPEKWFEWRKGLIGHINEAYRELGINKVVS